MSWRRGYNNVSILENSGSQVQVPLFADASMTDTDVTQTAADRFHRWLLNFTLIVQELRASELEVWHESLEQLLSRPEQTLEQPVKKASEWIELMHELQMIQSAYRRMLFGDQIIAVRNFEVRQGSDMSLTSTGSWFLLMWSS